MSYPKTKDEWWALVDLHWDYLLAIISDQIDLESPAYERPGQSDSPMTGRNIYDELGNRMKQNYEDRTRYSLPRRTYTVICIDGKAFHTLTSGFNKPFDRDLMSIMDKTAIELCSGIQGAVIGYVQSDEISIILADFATLNTCAWFDGNIQKIVSISASIAI